MFSALNVDHMQYANTLDLPLVLYCTSLYCTSDRVKHILQLGKILHKLPVHISQSSWAYDIAQVTGWLHDFNENGEHSYLIWKWNYQLFPVQLTDFKVVKLADIPTYFIWKNNFLANVTGYIHYCFFKIL